MRQRDPIDLQAEFRLVGEPGEGQSYRPLMIWGWNDRLDLQEIRRQARVLSEAGLGGFFIQPKPGLETPFLSEDWLDGVEAAVDQARQFGLAAWIHDAAGQAEKFASSGTLTTTGSRQKVMRVEMTTPGEPATAVGTTFPWRVETLALYSARLVEGTLHDWKRLDPVREGQGGADEAKAEIGDTSTQRQGEENGSPEAEENRNAEEEKESPGYGETVSTIQDYLDPAKPRPEDPLGGSPEDVLVHFYWEPVDGVDWLDPTAVHAFMASVHEIYYREFGEEFARTIPGFFLGAPTLGAPTLGAPTLGAPTLDAPPWSPSLPAIFQELYGQDLYDLLPAIFYEAPGHPSTRYEFWHTVNVAFSRACQAPLRRWCENREIQLAGCYEGPTLGQEVACSSGWMPLYIPLHLPGVQHQGVHPARPFVTKQASSISRQMQRRTLSQIMGNAGWHVTPATLWWIAINQVALGADVLCPHAALYSIRGPRKREEPPSLNLEPWWPVYRHLNDTLTRLLFLMTQGRPVVDLLVLHPLGSAWQQYQPGETSRLEDLGREVISLSQSLLEISRDFDYGDEALLGEHGSVEGDRLRVGASFYRAVFLPSVSSLSSSTLRLLQQLLESGGFVFYTGSLPGSLDGRPSDLPAKALEGALPVSSESGVLREALSVLPSRVSLRYHGGEGIYSLHRDAGRYQFLLLANRSLTEPVEVEFSLRGDGRLEEWNCETGTVTPVGARQEGDALHGRIQAPVGGGVVLALDMARPAWRTPAIPEQVVETVDLGDEWGFVLRQPNVLVLNHCSFKLGSGDWQPEQKLVHIREELEKAISTSEILLRFVVDLAPGVSRKELSLVLEDPTRWNIIINGNRLPEKDAGAWIDPGFRRFDVSRLLQEGRNILLMSHSSHLPPGGARISSPFPGSGYSQSIQPANLEHLYLLGQFSVRLTPSHSTDLHSFVLEPLPSSLRRGDLGVQGFPYFAGVVRMHQVFILPRLKDARVYLEMDPPSAVVVEAQVNGQRVGRLLWHPFRTEMTDYVRKGKNTLVLEIAGTAGNLLGEKEGPVREEWEFERSRGREEGQRDEARRERDGGGQEEVQAPGGASYPFGLEKVRVVITRTVVGGGSAIRG